MHIQSWPCTEIFKSFSSTSRENRLNRGRDQGREAFCEKHEPTCRWIKFLIGNCHCRWECFVPFGDRCCCRSNPSFGSCASHESCWNLKRDSYLLASPIRDSRKTRGLDALSRMAWSIKKRSRVTLYGRHRRGKFSWNSTLNKRLRSRRIKKLDPDFFLFGQWTRIASSRIFRPLLLLASETKLLMLHPHQRNKRFREA